MNLSKEKEQTSNWRRKAILCSAVTLFIFAAAVLGLFLSKIAELMLGIEMVGIGVWSVTVTFLSIVLFAIVNILDGDK